MFFFFFFFQSNNYQSKRQEVKVGHVNCSFQVFVFVLTYVGKQWLSGGVLDSRSRGCEFEPHWRHCVVFLSKTHQSLLTTGSTQEDLSRYD